MQVGTLIIGGGGFIGAHLTSAILGVGRKVTVLGRRSAPLYALPRGVTYISGDFRQCDLLRVLLDSHQEVVHLAYATAPNTSHHNPLGDLLANLPSTLTLFSEVAERGAKLVLVSSGGTVYGEALQLPLREDHPTKPISAYGVTKLTIENYARLYSVTHGLRYVCVRPSNAYGVGQQPFAGQGFIATAMASAMRGKAIKIFGLNGTIRDYLYVTDVAAGIASILTSGHLSETYNIGSGRGLSNREVVDAMTPLLKRIGCSVDIECCPERPFDVNANVLDSTKLRLHTNWQPMIEFDEGLGLTLDWLGNL